jgi:hypothetical protein
MGHIGFTGRTVVRRRNQIKHIKLGLCCYCSRKAVQGITICKYHQKYYKIAMQKAQENKQ